MSQPPDPYATPPGGGPGEVHGQPQPHGGPPPQQGGGPPGSGPYGEPVYGAPPPPPPGQPHPAYGQPQPPYGPPGGYAYQGADLQRPGTVLAGSILTWIGSGLALLLSVGLVAASASDEVLDLLPGATPGLVRGVFIGYAIWSAAVLVVSILAFRGSKSAAITLVVMGALFMLLVLVQLLQGQGTAVVPLVYVGACVNLVWTFQQSRNWFNAKAAARSAPAYPGYR